jgi:hypothetical protein
MGNSEYKSWEDHQLLYAFEHMNRAKFSEDFELLKSEISRRGLASTCDEIDRRLRSAPRIQNGFSPEDRRVFWYRIFPYILLEAVS